MSTTNSKTIGIDLGTTNSCVAVMEGGKPKVIPTHEGNNTFPSIVEPVKNLVGAVAKNQMILNSKNTVYSVKRLMGRKMSDPMVKDTMKKVAYAIVAGKDDMASIKVGGKVYSPQEISAKILQKAKADAEAYLGTKVDSAVITVPAYFDESQRQATKQAGEIAGLKVERIVNEPTASSLAYGLDKKKAETVAVYDFGGGTFDISILDLGEGVYEVKSTNGDTHLGGDDFDQRILDFLAEDFKKKEGIDLKKDRQALQRLRDGAEKAKIELSSSQESEISIPFITADQTGPKHLNYKLTRAKLEQLTDDLIQKSIKPCEEALKDAKLTKKDIDEVILVGGMTRMPKMQEVVKKFFEKEPHKGINPDEVVAVGAAIQAGVLGGEVTDVQLIDVTPLTLGLETLGGVRTPLIERNSRIPTEKIQVFSTAGDNQTQVEINVLQGEREFAADNKSLGRFILDGIPPAPRGIPQIEVKFDIDANGILNVLAKDKATGKEQKITITGSTGLAKDEVEKMTKDAEAHAEEDKNKKEKIEAKNVADNLCYQAEKTLKDLGDKIKPDDKKNIEEKVKELRGMLETAEVDTLKKKTEELGQDLQKIGQAMYQQQGQPGQNTEEKSEDKGDGKTEDDSNNSTKEGDVKEGEVVE